VVLLVPARRRDVVHPDIRRHRRRVPQHQGKAVRVDPIEPKLITPGTKRLKLKCDEMLRNVAFKFNLRRYTKVDMLAVPTTFRPSWTNPGWAAQVDPIKPMLKAPGCERLKLTWHDLLSNIAFNFNLRRFALRPARRATGSSIPW